MGCLFFKQKTAYERRIMDWSSDVCSSDLSDLLTVQKSVGGTLVLAPQIVDGAPTGQFVPTGIKFDGANIRYVGHSLGAITMAAFLGVDTDTGAAVLAMPGGGIARLLDGPRSEERRVGKECVRPCRSRGTTDL